MTETIAATQVAGLNLPITKFVLGTMTFGDTADEAASAAILDSALEAGITVVDTANGYAGGTTEGILGRLLGSRRDDVILASKAGMPHPDAGEDSPLSARALRASVEGSLARLGTDRIDLFYLHQPDRAAPLEETLSTFADLVREGKVQALGVSNFAAWQIGDVIRVADEVGAPRPVVAQQLYNLVARRIESEYLEFAAIHDLHTMVYNPLGGGLLTGKHTFEATPGEGRFGDSRLAAMYRERYWNEDLFRAIGALTEVAASAGLSLVELSFRWLFSQPGVGSVLLGGSKPEQFKANLPFAAAPPLDADLLKACDEIGATLNGPMPAYNR